MLCPFKFFSGGMIHTQKIPGNAEADPPTKRRDIFRANPDTCGCEGKDCALWYETGKACSLKK